MASRPDLSSSAQSSFADVNNRNAKFFRAVLNRDICTLHWHRRKKNAIRQIFEVIVVAADAYFAFNPVVIRRQIGIINGPVFTSSIMLPAFEVPLTHPQRYGIPQHGL